MTARGHFEAAVRVGYWWFWDRFDLLHDEDGAVARGSAEQMLSNLGAGDEEVAALAQHLLEQLFMSQPDIRAVPQLCTDSLCVSAATVEGREVLAVQFRPPAEKVERCAGKRAQATKAASAAQALIDRARKKRDKAWEKAQANHDAAVRRWENTRLRCYDGTRSPSCRCGYSWQGCCSHHGGVAGCPVDYPAEPEPDTSPLVPNEFVEAGQTRPSDE